jgi:predicted ArsR family transcriptional regulator
MDELRVLSDPTRRAILELARERGAADVTVDEASTAMEVHRSVAFDHLEMLAGVGLLERGRRDGRRGRPAHTYRYAGHALQFSYPQRQHQLLATILAGALSGRPEDSERVRDNARQYGQRLTAGKVGVRSAVRALSSLGGRYQLRGNDLHARNCIFWEACCSNAAVCTVHASIIEGAFFGAGASATASAAGADDTGGCWYRLDRSGGDRQ